MPTVIATSRSETHGFSKQPHASITLVANEGVVGDTHRGRSVQHVYLKRKDPAAPNLCQVHLFAAEMLDELAAAGFPLEPGDLGENLLTRGLDLLSLPLDTQLTIGSDPTVAPILQVTGLRTPCTQIDTFRPGLQQYLWGTREASGKRPCRAGIMAIVLRSGIIHPNDPIGTTLPPHPHHPLGPV